MRMTTLDYRQDGTLCIQSYFVYFDPFLGPLQIAHEKWELDTYISETHRDLVVL